MMGEHVWGMGWWWLIGLILVITVTWLILKSINQNTGSTQSSEKSAIDILKERYASGEIDKQEFEERKKDLM